MLARTFDASTFVLRVGIVGRRWGNAGSGCCPVSLVVLPPFCYVMKASIKMPDCPEGLRLWSHYRDATLAHVRLEGKLRLAKLEHDTEALDAHAAQFEETGTERNRCRDAYHEHKASPHEANQYEV